MKKLANLYLKYKYVWDRNGHGRVLVEDKDGYLFSHGIYPTKVKPEDLPEWYVFGYLYKCHGYISAAGVKDLLYRPSKFSNHMFKDDFLYISYNKPIQNRDRGIVEITDCDERIYGWLIVSFLEAVEKYSSYDISEIKAAIEEKRKWFKETYPDDYAREVHNDEPFFQLHIAELSGS